jgi:hypothetical protein
LCSSDTRDGAIDAEIEGNMVIRSALRRPLPELAFVATLMIFLFYTWYRYPFEISDSGTSAGYQDTPLPLKVGKYLLIFALAPCFLFAAKRKSTVEIDRIKGPWPWMFAAVGMLYLMLVPLVMGITSGEGRYFDSAFSWAFGLLILIFGPSLNWGLKTLYGLLRLFGIVCVLFFYLELTLYLTIGKIPALSYSNSLIIRYGGIWDDPNGFAFIWALLFPVFLSYRWRWFLLPTGIAAFLGTQAVTGVASVIIMLGVAFALVALARQSVSRSAIRHVSQVSFCIFAVLFVIALQVDWDQVISLLIVFLSLKSASVDAHLSSLDVLKSIDLYAALGVRPRNAFGESGYINWGANFGVAYFVVAVLVVGASVLRMANAVARNAVTGSGHIAFASLWFLCAATLGMTNLSLDRIFPLNFLTTLLCGLVLKPVCSDAPEVTVKAAVASGERIPG